RQPDVLYISVERLREYGLDSIKNVPFLEIPPDLTIEIISPSESRTWIEDKLTDYHTIGVKECWLVRLEPQTVEVIQVTPHAIESIGVFKSGEVIESQVLPQLRLSVNTIFAPPDFLKW
ncbi:MAG: Uma2 family endonuclease, partial [Candidatus Poribacteria bacterium]|nr:Uma2 family endonuclease [Candidatus Poribacteria bacterium]